MFSPDKIKLVRRLGLGVAVVVLVVLAVVVTSFVSQSSATARASQGVTERLRQLQSENEALKGQLKEFELVQPQHFGVKAEWKDATHKQAITKYGSSLCFSCHDEILCEPCHKQRTGE